jgi:hypothetical protein
MAAAFIPKGASAIRKRLRADLGTFHWSEDKDPERRMAMVKKIIELGIDIRATVARKVLPRDQEAGRARCFGSLVVDLAKVGGKKLTIDKRDTDAKNDRDTAQIQNFVDRGILLPEFEHGFKAAGGEPIIWIADAVAGAVQAQYTERNAEYVIALVEKLRLRDLP